MIVAPAGAGKSFVTAPQSWLWRDVNTCHYNFGRTAIQTYIDNGSDWVSLLPVVDSLPVETLSARPLLRDETSLEAFYYNWGNSRSDLVIVRTP